MPPLYFRPPATVGAAGPGIGITGTGLEQASAINALGNIQAIAVGNALLTAIDVRLVAGGVFCSIAPWDAQAANKCAALGVGDNAKTPLALALEFNRANAHAALTAALVTAGQAGNYAWLAAQICNHAIPNIIGVPAVAASSVTHGANWVTTLMVQNWATNAVQFPGPLAGQQAIDAALIIIAVLHASLGAGAGTHARVHWSAQSVSFTDTGGTVRPRPPFLALAHELIHAWHDITGTQTGHDINTYSRVVYEYLCIGLGDWAGMAISENAIRASAGIVLRTMY